MPDEWDDDGHFELVANQEIGVSDIEQRDPFDISKALEGAALEHLNQKTRNLFFIPNSDRLETSLKQLKI